MQIFVFINKQQNAEEYADVVKMFNHKKLRDEHHFGALLGTSVTAENLLSKSIDLLLE